MQVLAKPASEAQGSNPYTRLLYEKMRSFGVRVDEFGPWRTITKCYDVFHLHWPEYYIAHRNPVKAYAGTILLLTLIAWSRLRGAKVIWTVHNLESHNRTRPRAEGVFWKLFTRMVDGYISMNDLGRELIMRRFPATEVLPYAIIPHGHYRGAYPGGMDRCEARQRLEITPHRKMFLFFGTIARYKGLPSLVEAFRNMAEPEAILFVAGSVADTGIELFLREQAGQDSRIRLHLSRIPDHELDVYFAASDIVVLPFLDIFNSGSALLALSFDRPLLVSPLGAMPELQQLVGNEWISTYEGSLTAVHLKQAMDWALYSDRKERAPLEQFDWKRIALDTLNFYTTVSSLRATDLSTTVEQNIGDDRKVGQRD